MNNKIKKAIDRQISEKPLFTNEDRRRFYANKQNKGFSWWNQGFPKLLTAMTTLLLLAGSFYFFTSGNPFQSPASPEEETVKEGPVPEKEQYNHPPLDTRIKEIKNLVLNGPGKNQIRDTVESLDGVEIESAQEKKGTEELMSFVFAPDSEMQNTSFTSHEPPSLEAFQNGELDLFLAVQWNDESNGLSSATLTYLSDDGESLTEERFTGNALKREFAKVVGAEDPVSMKDLTLRSIARSLDKEPDSLTKSDLLELEELTINASHLNGIFDVEADPSYFEAMKSLRVLKLNQAIIPGELLKEVPSLEQVTFIGPTIKDLSRVAEGMQNVQYLNLINSSFQGNAEDILKLESLTIVRVDPSVVPDYEKLQFEGIDVRW
ncbi:hypothetical protein [Halobacillus sp. H74]|uniref:hypothetical protein n=1 Tax=Halobacillus sp. H74 TaxID=3457436 RepID=UPI003FCD40E5